MFLARKVLAYSRIIKFKFYTMANYDVTQGSGRCSACGKNINGKKAYRKKGNIIVHAFIGSEYCSISCFKAKN